MISPYQNNENREQIEATLEDALRHVANQYLNSGIRDEEEKNIKEFLSGVTIGIMMKEPGLSNMKAAMTCAKLIQEYEDNGEIEDADI